MSNQDCQPSSKNCQTIWVRNGAYVYGIHSHIVSSIYMSWTVVMTHFWIMHLVPYPRNTRRTTWRPEKASMPMDYRYIILCILLWSLCSQYHAVLDEAYPCTEQEMSLQKRWNLPSDKDAFSYHMSFNLEAIELAFGLQVQRLGIFRCPSRLSMHSNGVAIHIACWLHNIYITDNDCHRVQPASIGTVPWFEHKTNYPAGDIVLQPYCNTDGTPVKGECRSDLDFCHHRDMWADTMRETDLPQPTSSKFSKTTVQYKLLNY